MEGFATVDDYEARYGDVADPDRVEALLGDASAFIASQPGFRSVPEDAPGYELWRSNLARVACAVVRRSLSAGDWVGMSNVSQTAGSYNASVTLANPTEDFYLTKQERASLGLGRARVGQTDPFGVRRP